jgi:hypothetical protein
MRNADARAIGSSDKLPPKTRAFFVPVSASFRTVVRNMSFPDSGTVDVSVPPTSQFRQRRTIHQWIVANLLAILLGHDAVRRCVATTTFICNVC